MHATSSLRDTLSSTPSADAAYEAAGRAYSAAKKKLRWWLGGLGYAVFCLVGRFLPRDDLGISFFIFLDRHGAALAALVCAIGAADAFREERRELQCLQQVRQAWADARSKRLPNA
jgi:hypothetical protein